MLPTLGQLITLTTDVTVDQSYEIAVLDSDGSRRVLARHHFSTTTTVERVLEAFGPTPLVFWGPGDSQEIHTTLSAAGREGWYLPYPPADGIAIVPTEAPVNQVPYEQDFLNHCCTFAHELLTDFHPHAPRLRHIDSWNTAPDIDLDVDSIQRNRVGMRYYRGVLGYYYDTIVRFGSHPRNPDDLGQFETDWRTELAEIQERDRYVCGTCRDEEGGSRLRDFIHSLNISAWDTALDATVASGSGSSLRYTARLPRIDRSNPDDLRPHRTRNVRTWVSNVASVEGGWKSMMRDFDAAVKRWDRDPSVRRPSPGNPAI